MPTRSKAVAQSLTYSLYSSADFYLIRAPLLPAQAFLSLTSGSPALVEGSLEQRLQAQQNACIQELQILAKDPRVMGALAVASPSLLESVEKLARVKASPARNERTYAGLLRYLIRMSTRPTPFGLFSGVAAGTFADTTSLHLAFPPLAGTRSRPDMSWLLSLLQKIEANQEVVSQLRVSANQLAYVAGGRVLLPVADTYGQQDNRAISLRATSVVLKALELAQHFLPYAELHRALQEAFPSALPQQIDRLLWQLWENHLLVSDLHPPLTAARPAHYVYRRLSQVRDDEELGSRLGTVLRHMEELDAASPDTLLEKFKQTQDAQEKLLPAGEKPRMQIQMDASLALKAAGLHDSIGKAAAQIAELLLRMTPVPEGPAHLKEYRSLFSEKYGEHAEVPLLDLLSPEHGLDAPAGYTQPPRSSPLRSSGAQSDNNERERILQDLVMWTVNQRRIEVELTDGLLGRLESWSPRREQAPRSLEIYLQVHAHSRAALDRGEWQAVLSPNCGSLDAGRTFGRFFDILGEQEKEQLRALIAREESLLPEAIFAELSYQPPLARSANVAIRPPLRSYEIVVGTTPSVPLERVLLLSDLVVSIRNGRFYLRSLRLGKQVVVCQTHMLNIQLAPNVCRFISEISYDGLPLLSSFQWGKLDTAPFLPRVVRKEGTATLVLSPAQWKLHAGTIEARGTGSEEARWFAGLQYWREHWQVPRYVYLAEFDNRLLLDLEQPMLVAQLRAKLSASKETRLTLQELLPDFAGLWLRDEQEAGYFSEIVVPLLRSDALDSSAQREARLVQPTISPRVVTPRERKYFPGERWCYFKLYAAPRQHDEIIAGPLRDLIRALHERRLIDCWFYLRYTDPESHLRLRVRAREDASIQPLFTTLLQWSRQLAEQGWLNRYSIDSYERETERYGGPASIELLEQVFSIDSSVVSNVLAAQFAHQLTLEPLEVAVFTLDSFFAAWGYDFERRLQWIRARTEPYALSKEFRPVRKRYCELLAPWQVQPDTSLQAQRELLLKLTSVQNVPLGAVGRQVRALAEQGELWRTEDDILASLAHMHKIRLLDLDRQKEQRMYAFWRQSLESIGRRPTRGDRQG
ncbi:hypothetical protein EPA93_05220 [Ktedonosporobacter rubrisoli]|uniref:Lantibiotic dehydratase n=1 Tax=Ktedonosporobacter rubrisoli TaxID=2509675 RepID=A0A4P6JJX2_KTERU|nr:lantibiotic dehydratase [Ktedonosporobacter rubrisoli]QBD75434.1 hypothetical protein EPA93_05220 [Ktedonosporobacter rubrisoli]